jgi:hypothetical protein
VAKTRMQQEQERLKDVESSYALFDAKTKRRKEDAILGICSTIFLFISAIYYFIYCFALSSLD